MKRMTLIAAALAACSWAGMQAASAAPAIVITEAPPAARVETIPAPRPGSVWVQGHYAWRHGQYAWVSGHWQGARRGMQWEQAKWEQRPDGSWTFVEGHWRRGGRDRVYGMNDRDGDGVPNRYDDHPRNPYRN